MCSSDMHSPLTLASNIYYFERWGRLYSSYGDPFMTPWVHRVSYPSTVLDIFLTLLIAAGAIGGIAMLLLGILLFV